VEKHVNQYSNRCKHKKQRHKKITPYLTNMAGMAFDNPAWLFYLKPGCTLMEPRSPE
jgi:hypothetical protein